MNHTSNLALENVQRLNRPDSEWAVKKIRKAYLARVPSRSLLFVSSTSAVVQDITKYLGRVSNLLHYEGEYIRSSGDNSPKLREIQQILDA